MNAWVVFVIMFVVFGVIATLILVAFADEWDEYQTSGRELKDTPGPIVAFFIFIALAIMCAIAAAVALLTSQSNDN